MPIRITLSVVLAALSLGAALAWRHAQRPVASIPPASVGAELPTTTAEQLRRKLDAREDFLLVFVGTEYFFGERRIPGARCIAYSELPLLAKEQSRSREIVVYCGCCADAAEGVSGLAVKQLRGLGFTRVSHLLGHYDAWRRAGYAVEGSNPAAPIERAYANEAQRRELNDFVSDTASRRREIQAAFDHEQDPARRGELRRHLDETDREDEIRGLLLKRRLAEVVGDPAKVADIDRILRLKGAK